MAGCSLSKGKNDKQCRAKSSGVKIVDFGNFNDIDVLTIVKGSVTKMTLVDGARTYRYTLREELASFVEAGAGTRTTPFVRTQTLIVPLTDFTDDEIEELEAMAGGIFFAIVHLVNGRYRLAGHTTGLMLGAENDSSGTAYEDKAGTELTFTCKQASDEKAPFISATIVANLQIPTS